MRRFLKSIGFSRALWWQILLSGNLGELHCRLLQIPQDLGLCTATLRLSPDKDQTVIISLLIFDRLKKEEVERDSWLL
ncbi:unnamed protein product [Prunus armeniaca]|uniref:Uncharacterized protein n=1 Tax=Prunus armeniaca TaxID=36596 RepID=A0A6J5VAY7_PRUAR|nr:unnamed protein product [Prunus armeniaca]